MTTFGAYLEDNKILRKFLKETRERYEAKGINRAFSRQEHIKGNIIYVNVDTLIPSFRMFYTYIIGASILASLIFGLKILVFGLVCTFILGIVELFRSPQFSFFAFKMGLRKWGYKGSIKLMTKEEVIKDLIEEWD